MNFKKEKLDFSGKGLTEFPQEIFQAKRLYKLNLSNNKIRSIPKEIAQLKHLETLVLSHNNIRHLLAKLFELSNLKILILDSNEIINLPKQIEKMQRLKILNLAHNKLSDLPLELAQLSDLEELNLTGNKLQRLPLDYGCFPKLKALWIAHNPLRELLAGDIVDFVPNLKALYCFSPKIENKVLSTDDLIKSASLLKGNSLTTLRTRYAQSLDEVFSTPISDFSGQSRYPKAHTMKREANIFISYSHADVKYLNRLKLHLKALGRHIQLNTWEDTKLRSSEKWKDAIEEALDKATDAILLVSTDFLASDFINANELPPLLESARVKGTRLHSVIVEPCLFTETKSISQFQAANSPDEPLSSLPNDKREQILVNLCLTIKGFIE